MRSRFATEPVDGVHGDPIRLPPDVLDVEREHTRGLGCPQLQRRLLRRDRTLEYCNSVDFVNFPFPCTSGGATDPSGPDADDDFCAPASASFLIQVSGCTDTDGDFDGVSYQKVWPGLSGNLGNATVTKPVVFSSPQFNGGQNYDRVAGQTDLPRIEDPAVSSNNNCDRFVTGNGCINPPNGANFYPGFVARKQDGGCRWLEGGPNFPGNTNNFGGEVAQYGALLKLVYPVRPERAAGSTTSGRSSPRTRACRSARGLRNSRTRQRVGRRRAPHVL